MLHVRVLRAPDAAMAVLLGAAALWVGQDHVPRQKVHPERPVDVRRAREDERVVGREWEKIAAKRVDSAIVLGVSALHPPHRVRFCTRPRRAAGVSAR